MDKSALETTIHELEHAFVEIRDVASLRQHLDALERLPQFDSFMAYFRTLRKVQSKTPAGLLKASGINRSYCYHVFDESKAPGRDKILRLCLAAGLDNEETRRALESGHVAALHARSGRDAVIHYAIERQCTVPETNALLVEYGMAPLS